MGRVVVIGGGPGGSTAAHLAARRGHQVTLFERERFPREHIGESLLPATVPILEELGVREEIEAAGCLKKYGATMVWGRQAQPWSWYFRETNVRYPHAYQVWRPQFDQLLLRAAARAGVDVREGTRVGEVRFEGERAVGVMTEHGERVDADFVIDASGQAALIGNARKLRRWDQDFRNMAVYGYFAGARRLDPPNETNILVESYGEGWFWVIPLHVGVVSVGCVIDQDRARAEVRGDVLRRFLHEEIAKTTRTRALLADATMTSGPFSLRDWSYTSDRTVGDGWILVGDAACFVDPLFSSGVHLAMSAGMLAAAHVHCALTDEVLAAAAAPVYQELYYSQYYRFHEMAKLFYASNATVDGYFWEARRLLGEKLEQSDSARSAFIRAVAGQSPQGYERAVLAQGTLPSGLGESIVLAETHLAERRRFVRSLGERLGSQVARLADGVSLGREAVLDSGDFVWGETLRIPHRLETVPISPLVATLLALLDDRLTLGQAAERVAGGDDVLGRALGSNLAFLIETLYADGALELRDPSPA